MTKRIAIAGAGITGLTIATVLARAGHNVTIYDPAGFPAPNASFKAGGMLAPYSEIEHMHGDWIAAGMDGIAFWQDFSQNHDIGFHSNGSVLIAHPEDRYILDRFVRHLPDNATQEFQPPPALQKFTHTVFLKDEAHVNPHQTMQALMAQNDIDYKTENFLFDSTATYDHVIDCRGLGAGDEQAALRGVKGETLTVRNPDFTLPCPVRLMHPRYPLYIVPRNDHVFMIGATVIESDDNTAVSLRSAMELMSALYSLHPSFGEAEIIAIEAGIRPAYSDNLPRITMNGNRITCNGLFRHGYLLAPVMAYVVKEHISGQKHRYHDLLIKE